MSRVLRLVVCFVATATAAVCLNAFYPGGLVSFGTDLYSLPRLEAEVRQDAEKQTDLQERCDASLASINARQQIVANLVADFISLEEAAHRLRDLSMAAQPAVRKYSPYRFDQATDEVDLCLQVIDYVKAQLSFDPEFAAHVKARLQRELFRDGNSKRKNGRLRPSAEAR
jgi:hypothetical protein